MKTVVVFYSLDGNTRFIAEQIANHYQADLLELKPVKEISKAEPVKHIWGGKQVVMGETPQLQEYTFDPESYERIVIGTPVWSFTFTPPIKTFLQENNIQDKEIILFCTHRGLPAKTMSNLKKELSGNKIIGELNYRNVLGKKEKNRQKLVEDLTTIDRKT